jgi:heme exporter protein B
MLAKLLAHFAATGLPVALFAPPVLSLMMPGVYLLLPCLWAGLLLGGLCFSSIGLLGAALALGSRRNAALQAVIVLPLSVPPLIFGAGSVTSGQLDMGFLAPLAFLGAFACVSLTLSPFAAAWIVRMKVTTP